MPEKKDNKAKTKMPKAIKEAAEKMQPQTATPASGGGHDRNQLITRPGEDNRRLGRSSAANERVPKRGGPLLADVPEEGLAGPGKRIAQLQ